MKIRSVLSSLLTIALLVGLTVSCEDEFQPQPPGKDSDLFKKGSLNQTVTVVDADWLDVELVSAIADTETDGLYSFTVTWTLTPEAELENMVKTQGGLTAGVDLISNSENLTTPKKNGKQPKKNFILYCEEDGLVVSDPIEDGVISYTVIFTKMITALPGEEVELTGDWTSKWKEAEPRLYDPNPDPLVTDDEFMAIYEHLIGTADPVMWTVPVL